MGCFSMFGFVKFGEGQFLFGDYLSWYKRDVVFGVISNVFEDVDEL